MKRNVFSLCLLALFATATAIPVAQAQDLPAGDDIVAKHIEMSGGKDAYDKIENRVSEGTLEIVNQGLEISMTTYAAKPNKVYAVMAADAIGEIYQGIDGTNAWSLSDLQGPVVEKGMSLKQRLRDATFDRFVYWKKIYQSAECTGIEEVDGQKCYRVVFTPKPFEGVNDDSDPVLMTAYFDVENFLPIKGETKAVSQAGSIDVTLYLSDYREVDGIMIAHKVTTELAGQQRVMTMNSIKHNVELPADRFDPPEAIKELLDKN